MTKLFLLWIFRFASAEYYEDRFQHLLTDLPKMRPTMSWEVGINEKFHGMTNQQIRAIHTATVNGTGLLPRLKPLKRSQYLPSQFDARQKWPKCKSIGLIRDQSNCGSCWAVASASVMSDRHCIISNGTQQSFISDQYILTCCGSYCGNGCDGGYYVRALLLWKNRGVPTGGMYGTKHSCQPYTIHSKEEVPTPACSKTCIPQYDKNLEKDKHFGLRVYWAGWDESSIMHEIYTNGPVVGGIIVYEDYLYYKSGVYHHIWGAKVGGHAVRIIGWGVENGVKYWLVTNSYGKEYGEHGMFKIRRGNNECKIEEDTASGLAKLYDGDPIDHSESAAKKHHSFVSNIVISMLSLIFWQFLSFPNLLCCS